MASIRVPKGNNNPLVDLHYRGIRCMEQAALKGNAANRKKASETHQGVSAFDPLLQCGAAVPGQIETITERV